MLKNAYLLVKIGADTAENEQHFAEMLPNSATAVRGRSPDRYLYDRRRCTAPSAAAPVLAIHRHCFRAQIALWRGNCFSEEQWDTQFNTERYKWFQI